MTHSWRSLLMFALMVVAVMALDGLVERFTGWSVHRVVSRSLPSSTAAPSGGGAA